MFKDFKNISKDISEHTKVGIDKIVGLEIEGEPKVVSEFKYTCWHFNYLCDRCGNLYGPRNSRIPQIDRGRKIMRGFYMKCPNCNDHVCKAWCWNPESGTCLKCTPSREIELSRMVPRIRENRKVPKWEYFFHCNICERAHGPESTLKKQVDNGVNITSKHYTQCQDCGKFVCRSRCWNYEEGTCTKCNNLVPPEFIEKKGKVSKEYLLVCSNCRKTYGPMNELHLGKAMSIAFGSARLTWGLITLNPASVVGGGYNIATGSIKEPIGDTPNLNMEEKAKLELAKCPNCSKWVCIDDCWDKTSGSCVACIKT